MATMLLQLGTRDHSVFPRSLGLKVFGGGVQQRRWAETSGADPDISGATLW